MRNDIPIRIGVSGHPCEKIFLENLRIETLERVNEFWKTTFVYDYDDYLRISYFIQWVTAQQTKESVFK